MAKVAEYYSIKGTKVYHNNDEYTVGNNIEPENRRKGKGTGRTLCKRCKE